MAKDYGEASIKTLDPRGSAPNPPCKPASSNQSDLPRPETAAPDKRVVLHPGTADFSGDVQIAPILDFVNRC